MLAAAGSGERLGLDRPKAFANLRDRPLLAEPLERLEACEWIDSIVVAVPEGWEEPAILLAEELGRRQGRRLRHRRLDASRVGARRGRRGA